MRYSNSPFESLYGFTRKNSFLGKIIVLVIVTFGLAICWGIGNRHDHPIGKNYAYVPESEEEIQKEFPYLGVTDYDKIDTVEKAIELDLSQYKEGCEITEPGDYHLTGNLNGTLHINVAEQNVHLFLDNISITSVVGPAIYCEKADKLIITLLPGSRNLISDSGKYHPDQEVEACIYSVCDATFNGTGSLSVNGYYKDAIRSKDILKFLDGEYEIKCKLSGIHGNNGIVIRDGIYNISSEKNGLKTTKSGADGNGNIMVSGGELSIIAGRYGFVTKKADIFLFNCTVYDRSIVDTYDIGGIRHIGKGCVQ